MTAVFIGGSRRLSRLNKDVKRRLDNIIERGLTVIIGDANGADKAVQHYLSGRGYQKVIVFCTTGGCRNNVGNWPTREISAPPGARGFAYFSAKDRAMAKEADYGLMLWDGKSRGTLTSIVDLVEQGRPVVVYVAPEKAFTTLLHPEQLSYFVRPFDRALLRGMEPEMRVATTSRSHRKAGALLF